MHAHGCTKAGLYHVLQCWLQLLAGKLHEASNICSQVDMSGVCQGRFCLPQLCKHTLHVHTTASALLAGQRLQCVYQRFCRQNLAIMGRARSTGMATLT